VSAYSLAHLPDPVLLRQLAALVAQDRATTAALLAHLAEVDARRLYLPAAHPSMFSYCVHTLGLAEDAAYKRIQAARTARQFPTIFAMLADGRLHLSAVVLLAPYLTTENADELLAAAAHRSKAGLEQLLAQRFPRTELLPLVAAVPAAPRPDGELAPGQVGVHGFEAAPLAPGRVGSPGPRPQVAPLAPERYALQLTIGQSTYQKLRYAQALLGHQLPAGELAQVLDRALDALIRQLEQQKFAATPRPRPRPRRAPTRPRSIPAHVKRTVWQRDGGQCTFVSAAGQRCPARTRLEFDHVDPVARGGRATVERMRLRCRAHNQYAAERAFGVAFMRRQRQEAQLAPGQVGPRGRDDRQLAPGRVGTQAAAEVIPWLRRLGFRADEARRAAALCEAIPDAPLEERVRLALSCFAQPPHGRAPRSRPTAP
jgi:hypothetical protein